MTFDNAQEAFRGTPSLETARDYLSEALTYEADGMIGNDTFTDAIVEVRDFLKKLAACVEIGERLRECGEYPGFRWIGTVFARVFGSDDAWEHLDPQTRTGRAIACVANKADSLAHWCLRQLPRPEPEEPEPEEDTRPLCRAGCGKRKEPLSVWIDGVCDECTRAMYGMPE